MSTKRTPLTAQQACTLAGAYADLVFGTFAPEFIADIATAYLREEIRQKKLADEGARLEAEQSQPFDRGGLFAVDAGLKSVVAYFVPDPTPWSIRKFDWSDLLGEHVSEPAAKALEPGVVASKATGAEYWFNGKYLVPRSANGIEWGGGFAIGSHMGEQLGPFAQVSVLAPVGKTSEGRA